MRFVAVVVVFAALLAVLLLTRTARSGERISLIVTGGPVVTVDASGTVIADGAVAINGATIVMVGKRADVEARYAPARTIDAAGQIILPGLINTHTHAPM